MKNVSIVSALICEDIRQEVTGKFSLAGVFASGIDINSLPATIMVGVFGEVIFHETGEFEPEFRVIDELSNQVVKGNMKINVPKIGNAPITIGPFPVTISKPGEVKFQWKFGKAPWQTIKSFKVQLNSDITFPFSIGPQPIL